jgi:hypothetical protein
MNLNQVTLPAREVAPAVAFYQQLGLRLIVDALPRYVRFECPDGESTLSVEQVPELGVGPGPVIYLECEDLDGTVERLVALGNVCPNCGGGFVPRPIRPSTNWKGDNFLGKDPASSRIRHRPVDPDLHAQFAARIRSIPPGHR